MYRKFLPGLLALSFLVAVTVSGLARTTTPASAAPGPYANYYFGFDKDLGSWSASASNPYGGKPVLERVLGDDGCPGPQAIAAAGAHAVLKVPDGSAGSVVPVDGAKPEIEGTWIVKAFPAAGYSKVAVQYAAKNAAQAEGYNPMVYIGDKRPTLTTQFNINQLPLKNSWQHFQATGAAGGSGIIYVAIGWNGTQAAMALDCISITIGNPGPDPSPVPLPNSK